MKTLICSHQFDVSYNKMGGGMGKIMKWMHRFKFWHFDWEFVLVWGKYQVATYEGWNFNSGNYLFTTDTK